MNHYTIFTKDRIKIGDEIIEDPKRIGHMIRKAVNEVLQEEVSIYWEPAIKDTKGWKKVLMRLRLW